MDTRHGNDDDLHARRRREARRSGYENGVLIVATVDIVTFAVPATVPAITDMLVIDGKEQVITSLKPTPAAGTVVKWTAIAAV